MLGVCVNDPQLKFYLLFWFLQNNYVSIATSFIGENGPINTMQSLVGLIGAGQCLKCMQYRSTYNPAVREEQWCTWFHL